MKHPSSPRSRWRLPLLAGAGLLLAAAETARASLTLDVFRIVDDSTATLVSFGPASLGQRFVPADSYVRLNYPSPIVINAYRRRRRPAVPRLLRRFTDNPVWNGTGLKHNGLLDAALTLRIPLYSRAFENVQSGGTPFDLGSFPSWSQVHDPADDDWDAVKDSDVLSQFPDGVTYVYLGADNEAGNPMGTYQAPLVFELFSAAADTQSPGIRHNPFTRINDLFRPFSFVCDVDEDLDLSEAVLHYRTDPAGPWSQVNFFINDDPVNPFLFHLRADLPISEFQGADAFQYWFTVSDGLQESEWNSASAPAQVELNPVLRQEVSSQGGVLEYMDGQPDDGVTAISFPRGALRRKATVRMRKRNPAEISFLPDHLRRAQRAAPGAKKAPPVSVWPVVQVEAEDDTRTLDRPALLTIVYDDLDSDGKLDGTSIKEGELRIFRWDGHEWLLQGGNVNAGRNHVRTPVSTLGLYALFPAPGPASLRSVQSIFTPGTQDNVNDVVHFDGAAGDSVVRIFDVAGRLVREVRDLGYWDGRDEQGRLVETGVYIYQVESGGRKVSGTITVAK